MKTLLALMAAVMLVMPAMAFEQGKSNQAPTSPSKAIATSTAPTSTATAPDTHSTGSAPHTENFFSTLFTSESLRGMIGTVVYFLLALLMLAIGYKVVDFITPGNLGNELLGVNRIESQPNYALAIVAGALLLGLSIIIAAAIH
jgi:hypothetical protein